MKATIDIPDDLYRKVKAKSALEGRPVREVVVRLFRGWIDEPERRPEESVGKFAPKPTWLGSLRPYARNAKGVHEMESIRKSVARKRAAEWGEGEPSE